MTDQNGFYSAIVPYAWSGTVKPVKEGWQFAPASIAYQRVTGHKENENYTPMEITFTISGKVTGPGGPMSGVQLTGLPNSPITGADGSYSDTVPYGWAETFTPIKEGFTFTPSNKGFAPVKSNQTQNFSAAAIQLLITGNVGAAGVKIKGLPGSVITGANGVFSAKVDYGWTGTITPEKAGYEFDPAELNYTNIIVDQTNENFNSRMLTYIVSGTTGMAGVEMKGLPGNPYTDQNGYFEATVNHGFSGTVTPTKEGYKFTPASLMLVNVNSDRTDWTCTGEIITLTISGSTRLEGVQMMGLPGNPLTDKDGNYKVMVDFGWSGTVQPIKEGFKFTPESRSHQAVTADATNQTYSYSKMTYAITGTAQMGGVMMKGFPGKAVVTNASGQYTATVEHGWSGTVTPTLEGYEFQPASAQITNVMGPQSGQDFVATMLRRKISGTVRSRKGQPVEGVNIVADNNGGQATTDAAGQFELVAGYGWTGSLTALKEGYTFSPPTKRIAPIRADQMNQTFIGTAKMFTVTGKVEVGGIPIDGVLITASDGSATPITATTDLQGKYTFQVPFGWTGEVAPTKEGINFTPASQPLVDVRYDVKDFQQVIPDKPAETVIPPVKPRPAETTVVTPGERPPTGITVPGEGLPPGVEPGPTSPDEVKPTTPAEKQMQELQAQLEELKAILAGKAPERPTEPGAILISNSWMDNDLALDVLPAISQQAGIPIIADEGVGGYITLELKDTPLEQALTLVLAGTPFTYKKRDGYYLVAQAGLTDTKFSIFSETRRVRMNYITAQAAVALLSTAFQPYVQAELPALEQVRALGATAASGGLAYTDSMPNTYTVIVTAPPALMERIIADLKKMDTMPDQVLLKARVVSMARTDLLNLGVEWGWPTMQLGFFAGDNYGFGDPANDFGGKAPWGIQMGYTPDFTFTNALQLALNLLTVNGEATIRAEPQVLAQDNKQATMRVVNEEYFFLTADVQDTGQFFTNSQLETIESGTTLTITPHIVDGDRIVLKISIEVSDSIPAGRDTELPIVTRRTADNVVEVQDGGTVAVAGLSQEKSATTHKRTPGLSSLPLIGALFNNKDDITTSREVAVFVTANIVRQRRYDPAAAAIPRAAPAPAPRTFPRTPSALNQNRPLVDPTFNQYRSTMPINQPRTMPPADPIYSRPTTPINPSRATPPVDSIYNRTTPSRVPGTRPRGNFQMELEEELRRNR
jgi:hypothetical protein